MAALPVRRAAMPNRVPNGGGAERLREHLSEMQRLMEFMQQEMENLEQER
jgi:hypothetical protein